MSLATVPPEILTSIFNYLDRFSIYGSMLVSSHWYKLLIVHPAAAFRTFLLAMHNNPYMTCLSAHKDINTARQSIVSNIDKVMVANEQAQHLKAVKSHFNMYYWDFVTDHREDPKSKSTLADNNITIMSHIEQQLHMHKHSLKNVEFFPLIYMQFDAAPEKSSAYIKFPSCWQEGSFSHAEIVLPCLSSSSNDDNGQTTLFIGYMSYSLCSGEKGYKHQVYRSFDSLFYIYHAPTKTYFVLDDNVDKEAELEKAIDFILSLMVPPQEKQSVPITASPVARDLVVRMIFFILFRTLSIEAPEETQYVYDKFMNINDSTVPWSSVSDFVTNRESRRIGYDTTDEDLYSMSLHNKSWLKMAPSYIHDIFKTQLHIYNENLWT